MEICIECSQASGEMRYYIYKLDKSGVKHWLTCDLELNRYRNSKAYITDWEKVSILVNKIFTGEIN